MKSYDLLNIINNTVMSYKSENWKEKLEQVRGHISLKEGSVEKSADEILNDQIEEELATFFQEEEVIEEELVLDQMGDMIKKVFNKIVKQNH